MLRASLTCGMALFFWMLYAARVGCHHSRVGLGLGIAAVGWNWPVSTVKTPPSALSPDWQSDWVLMTAQAYSLDGDLSWLATDALLGEGDLGMCVAQRGEQAIAEDLPARITLAHWRGWLRHSARAQQPLTLIWHDDQRTPPHSPCVFYLGHRRTGGRVDRRLVISPVEYTSVEPSELKPDFRATYVQLVAASFAFENDWTRADFRLQVLRANPENTARQVREVTERAIAKVVLRQCCARCPSWSIDSACARPR